MTLTITLGDEYNYLYFIEEETETHSTLSMLIQLIHSRTGDLAPKSSSYCCEVQIPMPYKRHIYIYPSHFHPFPLAVTNYLPYTD